MNAQVPLQLVVSLLTIWSGASFGPEVPAHRAISSVPHLLRVIAAFVIASSPRLRLWSAAARVHRTARVTCPCAHALFPLACVCMRCKLSSRGRRGRRSRVHRLRHRLEFIRPDQLY